MRFARIPVSLAAVGLLALATPTQQTPRRAPNGLAAGDWAGIRAAYEAQRHAARPVEDGHRAHNPRQRWSLRFDGRGFTVRPDGGGWTWGLELERYGFPGREEPVTSPSSVSSEGGRVTYGWNEALAEWYVNDARGLEHGYTLHRRPPRERGGQEPLTFSIAVRGELRAEVASGGRTVRFVNNAGATILTYAGLYVFDADGRALAARFQSVGEDLLLSVDERGARYPLTIDPLAQQAYLKASNTDTGDGFGVSVAVSGDTVVVGATGEQSSSPGVNADQDDNSFHTGAAYVFVRCGTSWVQQAYLKASNPGSFDNFGISVAISGDTVVVGASSEDSQATGVNGDQDDDSAGTSGATYVFVRNGTSWSQQAYLKASNTQRLDHFGTSVAVSGDTVLVGARGESSQATGVDGDQSDDTAPDSGAVYVFVRDGTSWSQRAYLKASNTEANDRFGVSLAACGDTFVIGAVGEDSYATGVDGDQDDNSAVNSGAAYVFVRDGTTWIQEAYLKASNTGVADSFGLPVAISGNTVVVGAVGEDSQTTGVDGDPDDDSASRSGAAYVFSRSGATWSQEAYLKAANTGESDHFGTSVSISGQTILVGARGEGSGASGVNGDPGNDDVPDSGAAYVFGRNGTSWSQQAYLKAVHPDPRDFFGLEVAVDGETLVVGAPKEQSRSTGVNGDSSDNSYEEAGAAYVFRPLTECVVLDFETEDDFVTPLVNGQALSTPPEFGNLVALSAFGLDNYGAAIFDSNPAGPNAGGSDPDLLVGLGNLLILQENASQSVPDIYDDPDDAQLGGTVVLDFTLPVELCTVDLVDICPGPPVQNVTLTLIDEQLRLRTYFVPGGWTNDLASDGPPGYGTLDLTSLTPQAGFQATATASEDPGFDPFRVLRLEVFFHSSGALDNLEICRPVESQAPEPDPPGRRIRVPVPVRTRRR